MATGPATQPGRSPAQATYSRPSRRIARCELWLTMLTWLVICTPSSSVMPPLASMKLKGPM